MDYATKLAHWNETLKSVEDNIKIGQQMKAKGMAILNSLEIDRATQKLAQDFDPKVLAELVKQSTLAIKEGVKLEADSRDKRGKLMNSKPYEF